MKKIFLGITLLFASSPLCAFSPFIAGGAALGGIVGFVHYKKVKKAYDLDTKNKKNKPEPQWYNYVVPYSALGLLAGNGIPYLLERLKMHNDKDYEDKKFMEEVNLANPSRKNTMTAQQRRAQERIREQAQKAARNLGTQPVNTRKNNLVDQFVNLCGINKENDPEYECAICKETDLANDPPVILECCHVFGANCLIGHIKANLEPQFGYLGINLIRCPMRCGENEDKTTIPQELIDIVRNQSNSNPRRPAYAMPAFRFRPNSTSDIEAMLERLRRF